MPRPRYKQKCAICKKNSVIMYSAQQFPICVECHLKQINQPITDPQYKKILDIPQHLYEKSLFLRNIKGSYLRFGSLSEKQIEAFKKAVVDLTTSLAEESKAPATQDQGALAEKKQSEEIMGPSAGKRRKSRSKREF